MRKLLQTVSIIGLLLVALPPMFYLADSIEKGAMTNFMLLGTILWFASVPFWMGREAPAAGD